MRLFRNILVFTLGQLSSAEHNSFQSSVCPATFPSFSIPPGVVPRPFRVSPRVSSQWLLSEESTKGSHLRGIQIRPPALRRSDTSCSSRLSLLSMNPYPTAPLTSASDFKQPDSQGDLELVLFGPNKPSASPCWEIPPVASQSSQIISSFHNSSSFSSPCSTCTFFHSRDESLIRNVLTV